MNSTVSHACMPAWFLPKTHIYILAVQGYFHPHTDIMMTFAGNFPQIVKLHDNPLSQLTTLRTEVSLSDTPQRKLLILCTDLLAC